MNMLGHITAKRKAGKKLFAVLVDPEKTGKLDALLESAEQHPPDLFLIGGSAHETPAFSAVVQKLKNLKDIPVVIFPGHPSQIDPRADALLLLSLISGRNPDHLIGQHVNASLHLKKSGLEIIPTGYILIDGGKKSTTAVFTKTEHLSSSDKNGIISTALAGAQLGMKMIYLEAGSGAPEPVTTEIIEAVRKEIDIPLIVGGGIRNAGQLTERFGAGADMIVVGNILEHDPSLLLSFVTASPSLPL